MSSGDRFGILGEDESDFQTLREVIWCLRADRSLTIRGGGLGGKGGLLNDGARALRLLLGRGFDRFVICQDADSDDPAAIAAIRRAIDERILRPAGAPPRSCIVVPVQAIEAWILADLESLRAKFSSWRPAEVKSPEKIAHPKEELVRLSRQGKANPRYIPPTHNPQVVRLLDLRRVADKCPSFRPLRDFVLESRA